MLNGSCKTCLNFPLAKFNEKKIIPEIQILFIKTVGLVKVFLFSKKDENFRLKILLNKLEDNRCQQVV